MDIKFYEYLDGNIDSNLNIVNIALSAKSQAYLSTSGASFENSIRYLDKQGHQDIL